MGRSSRYASFGKVQMSVLLYCLVALVTGLPLRYRQPSCGSSVRLPNTCKAANNSALSYRVQSPTLLVRACRRDVFQVQVAAAALTVAEVVHKARSEDEFVSCSMHPD